MYDLHLLADAPIVDRTPEIAELDPQEQLITAAVLAATAFRMKDMPGLLYALRSLAEAVEMFERERDAA